MLKGHINHLLKDFESVLKDNKPHYAKACARDVFGLGLSRLKTVQESNTNMQAATNG